MARRESTPEAPGSRALIVDLVRSLGPVSRVELVEATGLTQPAVSMIVRKLLDDAVIVEVGSAPSSGGKPRRLLDINERAVVGVGVQMGFESVTFVATNPSGGVLARQGLPGAQDDPPEAVVRRLADSYQAFIAASGFDVREIVGVTVAVPGPLAPDREGILEAPALPGWTGFALRAELDSLIDAPVLVDNDAGAAALGEFWSRGVSRYSTFGAIYVGTGVGAGVVIDGALFRGASSNAGELGHVSLDPTGPLCVCGNRGCLEVLAGPRAVVSSARNDPRIGDLALSDDPRHVLLDFEEISRAAIAGHQGASDLVTLSADRFAAAALTLTNLFDLDQLVLTGPALLVSGALYVRHVRDVLQSTALARRAHPVIVDISANPLDSAAIGAASLALQRSLAPGHGPAITDTSSRPQHAKGDPHLAGRR
ncbi:MAG: ROK family transcriptional regulator [Propionibacteriaceae bacterium]|jgi:predicted NBD/HSP70 family sugar kinase|nr:ROK family transcriptional regulator [Propionibacteriaceae bacterium]